MPEQNKKKEQSVLSRTASAAGAAKGALKAGKAIAGAAKGAAAGPYGMLAAGLWENRKVIGKVLAAIGALVLIPVLFILIPERCSAEPSSSETRRRRWSSPC